MYERAGPYDVTYEPASMPFNYEIGSNPLPTPASTLSKGTECPLKFQTVF